MNRRLYFLLPDVEHARRVVEDLTGAAIKRRQIHVLSKCMEGLEDLPQATRRQQKDTAHRAEHWLWNANMAVFFVALIALIYSVATANASLAIIMLGVMILTFVGGLRWTHVPDTNLQEFRNALSHGEVLLMVDVHRQQLPEVENMVLRQHPGAIAGGTTWTVDAMGL